MINKSRLSLCCLLVLCSCVSRESADVKLAKGCEAAANIIMDEGFVVKKIKETSFKDSEKFGNGYRLVTLTASISDEWLDIDKEYSCTFAEEFVALGTTHRATLYQIKTDDLTIGFQDGKTTGDMNTQLAIKNAVDRAMHQ